MGYSAALLQSVQQLVEGSVEGIAILAAVLVRVAMPIVDTNPHSSTLR